MIELQTLPAATPAFTQRDEARMRRAAEKQAGADQALDTLKNLRSRGNEDLKTQAREKVEALKRRLQQLRMLGASPRALAEVARELGRAVKDYAGAGGKPASVEAAGAAAPVPPDPMSPEDRAFVAEARRLARALKDAAADTARRAWLSGDADDAAEAVKAAKAAEEAVEEAERDMRRTTGAFDLTA